jgi:phosphoribosyl-ATP pyrophosphohydrolase
MTFEELYNLLVDRKKSMPEGSTTTHLMTNGLSSILPKLNEECYEVGLALEHPQDNDLALEVSQCFYYLICVAVFTDEPFSSLKLENDLDIQSIDDKHELAKKIAHSAAEICQTPCLATFNTLPPLLLQALDLGECTIEQMFSTL